MPWHLLKIIVDIYLKYQVCKNSLKSFSASPLVIYFFH